MSRKTKTLILALALLTVVAAGGFSLGLGLAYSLPIGNLPGGIMFSLKLDEVPFILGLNYSLQDTFRVGATADWWLATGNLVGFINYYLGPGLYAGIGDDTFDVGLRVPIGINMYPIPEFELFIEIAPAIPFFPNFPQPFAQAAGGFRFWF
ncbi:MAG: hypothetical protein ACOCZB_08295 [Spirochaetota bacterium]